MQKVRSILRHPLFPYCLALDRVERLKGVTLHWETHHNGQDRGDDRTIPCVEQGLMYGPVMSHGGSSFGNIDNLLPHNYPLSQVPSEAPILRIYASGSRLHCRPAELYLGASTVQQQLGLYVFWDQNAFDREMVEEWLGEVRGAAEFYLGQTKQCPP